MTRKKAREKERKIKRERESLRFFLLSLKQQDLVLSKHNRAKYVLSGKKTRKTEKKKKNNNNNNKVLVLNSRKRERELKRPSLKDKEFSLLLFFF